MTGGRGLQRIAVPRCLRRRTDAKYSSFGSIGCEAHTRALLVLLLLCSGFVQAAIVTRTVDLNSPGALESLRDQRPTHYTKARAILAIAKARPASDLGRWIEARFDASDVELLLWRVSDPPKLGVSFTLDDTRYTAYVVPVLPPVRAIPAR